METASTIFDQVDWPEQVTQLVACHKNSLPAWIDEKNVYLESP